MDRLRRVWLALAGGSMAGVVRFSGRWGYRWTTALALVGAVVLVGLGIASGRGLLGTTGGAPAEPPPSLTAAIEAASPTTAPSATAPTASPIGTPMPPSEAWPFRTATGVLTASPSREWHLDVPILTYHVIAPRSVASSYSEPGLDVDPALFDAQLALLHAKGWHSITADRLWRYVAALQRPPAKTFVITIDDGHEDGYTYALPILQRYGFVATYYVVVGRVGHPDDLTWEQIAAIQAAGMEIGNHTMDHVDLAALSLARLLYEIDAAQLILTAHLGAAPTTLAYPFWAFDSAVIRVVRAAGLEMAMTRGPVPYESATWRYVTPRLEVGSDTSPLGLLAELSARR